MRFILIFFLIGLMNCTSEPVQNEHDKKLSVSVTIAPATGLNVSSDQFTFEEVTIENDTLTAVVRYGGGCRLHQFDLRFSGVFMESYPVQVNAKIIHNANNDMCKAYLLERLKFPLLPLKENYMNSYETSGEETIIIKLENWDGELSYTFSGS